MPGTAHLIIEAKEPTTPSPHNRPTGATSWVGSTLKITGGGQLSAVVGITGVNAKLNITDSKTLGKVEVDIELD